MFHKDSLSHSDVDVVKELRADIIINALAEVLEASAPADAVTRNEFVHRYNQIINDLQAAASTVTATLTSKES